MLTYHFALLSNPGQPHGKKLIQSYESLMILQFVFNRLNFIVKFW